MSLRENLTFETTIASDTAALHGLVAAMVRAVPDLHCLRDPTRGGLATTLNELARRWWWTRLEPDWRPRTTAESQAILDEVGLTGDFWRLG